MGRSGSYSRSGRVKRSAGANTSAPDNGRRKPEGLGKKATGWIYWNGSTWVRAKRGQLGTLRARGFKVKRLEDHLAARRDDS